MKPFLWRVAAGQSKARRHPRHPRSPARRKATSEQELKVKLVPPCGRIRASSFRWSPTGPPKGRSHSEFEADRKTGLSGSYRAVETGPHARLAPDLSSELRIPGTTAHFWLAIGVTSKPTKKFARFLDFSLKPFANSESGLPSGCNSLPQTSGIYTTPVWSIHRIVGIALSFYS